MSEPIESYTAQPQAQQQSKSANSPITVENTLNVQQNNTFIQGEFIPIATVLSAIPESYQQWMMNYLDNGQQLQAEARAKEQEQYAEASRADKQREREEIILDYKKDRNGKTCALLGIFAFVALLIVCVMYDKLVWGITGAIIGVITVVAAFRSIDPTKK